MTKLASFQAIIHSVCGLALALALSPAQARDDVPDSPAVANFSTCTKPVWPRTALRFEQQGTVTLSFLIGTDGAVADSRIEKSSGFPLLDDAAQAGISRCKFKPRIRNGVAEQSWVKMQYVWTLGPPKAKTTAQRETWLEAESGAARGEPDQEYKLAVLLMTAQGAKRNLPEVRRLLESAAQKDHAQSKALLAALPGADEAKTAPPEKEKN
jgi:uncharacterized protein